jgi:hypothetical protein
MSPAVRDAFEREWQAAMSARGAGDLDASIHHLERAHVLGQRITSLHIRGHWGLLDLGWRRGDVREVIGQVPRLVAALLFTWLWVPEGNTGRANVSAFRKLPIPDDLRDILGPGDRGDA